MKRMFFFGSLRDRELLELVLDRPVRDGDLMAGQAPGFAAMALARRSGPMDSGFG